MTYEERQELIDAEHLRILRICYLVSGGTNALWAFFPLIHITLGVMMMAGALAGHDDEAMPAGVIFVVIGVLFSLFFATGAVLKLLAAKYLRERRRHTFCLVVAGLTCLGIPYGTALGALTFVVLLRPSVKALFSANPA